MTLSNSCSSVKVEMDLSERFDIARGFRKDDLFNFCERRECIAMAKIFSKSVQLFGYANDFDITEYTKRDVTVAFSVIERKSTKMGLPVNEV